MDKLDKLLEIFNTIKEEKQYLYANYKEFGANIKVYIGFNKYKNNFCQIIKENGVVKNTRDIEINQVLFYLKDIFNKIDGVEKSNWQKNFREEY
ncbi:hypothetical protein ACJDU8_12270 [Clostridium sp. WILCCON 0269]|uniref:Uncharacterized protein n=1 Tax=Candidatus Clostridium eludens TaxID=3381663 RepID=A0ABW8SL30_9CLOT